MSDGWGEASFSPSTRISGHRFQYFSRHSGPIQTILKGTGSASAREALLYTRSVLNLSNSRACKYLRLQSEGSAT
ncbi:uncharacterized protein PHALS_05939 [Plasmopara halstedii]|uniref:Uncharacterized protein n=1 Tax=Plasmopara halstedii TaxID=4781 RepID=A0A0N7L475_PLAHL|nr:uncharacterized protein PHALS_05939 [Plasmopara halstedii]CEG37891.1 hypothetical protein PHALS_05939 [Plasmopara halstedii]|eukprot:XP_024574260.1 hypothetical protein PHALS_05939 [Plasmopara halstedii]